VTLDDVEQERPDPTGLTSRPDARLSLRLRAHAGHVGAVMMAVAVAVVVVCVWLMISDKW